MASGLVAITDESPGVVSKILPRFTRFRPSRPGFGRHLGDGHKLSADFQQSAVAK